MVSDRSRTNCIVLSVIDQHYDIIYCKSNAFKKNNKRYQTLDFVLDFSLRSCLS